MKDYSKHIYHQKCGIFLLLQLGSPCSKSWWHMNRRFSWGLEFICKYDVGYLAQYISSSISPKPEGAKIHTLLFCSDLHALKPLVHAPSLPMNSSSFLPSNRLGRN